MSKYYKSTGMKWAIAVIAILVVALIAIVTYAIVTKQIEYVDKAKDVVEEASEQTQVLISML